MRINKSQAEQVAEKLVQSLKDKTIKLAEEISEIVRQDFMEGVPKEIISVRKKHPKYFVPDSGCFRYTGAGLGNLQCFFAEDTPRTNNQYDYYVLKTANAQKVAKKLGEQKDLSDKIYKLKSDTVSVLLKLATYRKIQTEFPEAFLHLPDKITTEIAIPLEDLRKQLNQK